MDLPSKLLRHPNTQNTKKENRHKNLGLKRNPFPKRPGVIVGSLDDRENGDIYLPDIRQDETSKFKKILIPHPEKAEPKTITFLLDYATRKGRGIGKTAFLKYQQKTIMQDLGYELTDGNNVLLAVYITPVIDSSYRKFWNISKLIIDSLIEQDVISLALCRIRAFYGGIEDEVLNQVTDNLQDTIGDDNWLEKKYKDINKTYDRNDLNFKVISKLKSEGIEIGLAKIITNYGNNSILFKKWFIEKQKDSYWRDNANKVLFDSLVRLFNVARFTKCILLFDELEKIIVRQNQSERRMFCESLRYCFIDGGFENIPLSFYSIFLTIHPYLQELLNPHWKAAGLQRFSYLSGELTDDYTVYFKSLSEASAIPLAKAYLDVSRINPTLEDELYPFTEEALKEALTSTMGIPGKYLTLLSKAIESAVDENWPEITDKEIKQLNDFKGTNEQQLQIMEDNDDFSETQVDLTK